MFLKIIRNILAFTPFIRPTMGQFYKLSDKSGLLNRIPLLNNLLSFIPPLKWIDNKLKYPILTIGRIIISFVVVYFGVNFTLNNNDYKETVNNKIIAHFAPNPIPPTAPSNTGGNIIQNSLSNFQESIAANTKYAADSAGTAVKQNAIKEAFYGPIGTLLRAPLIWLAYSLLFFLFGNTQGQLDQLALNRVGGLRNIGTEFVKNLGLFINQNKLAELNKKYAHLDDKKKLYDKDYQNSILELFRK